jgi:WD40 repeat protein
MNKISTVSSDTLNVFKKFRTKGETKSVAFTVDNHNFAAGGEDRILRIYDLNRN